MDKLTIFILTNGRPNNVKTYYSLRKHGYTGKIYLIIDNEDKTIEKYRKKYNSEIIVFNKSDYQDKIDFVDNFGKGNTILYARYAVWDIAKQLGIKYFMQFDDDYTNFRYRFFNEKYMTKGSAKSLDIYFNALLEYYKETNITSIAIAQGGDFIGGEGCGMISNYINQSRKCMNSFLCSTERPFEFTGRINSDATSYVKEGSKGKLFLTVPFIGLEQAPNQASDSGMSALSKKQGTYIKSFYSVIQCPSSIKISLMGFKNNRLHHNINWETAVPKIISETHKK